MISVGIYPNDVMVHRKRVNSRCIPYQGVGAGKLLKVGDKCFRGIVVGIKEHHLGYIITIKYKSTPNRQIYMEPPCNPEY